MDLGKNVQQMHKYVQVKAIFGKTSELLLFSLTSEDVHLKHFNSEGNL